MEHTKPRYEGLHAITTANLRKMDELLVDCFTMKENDLNSVFECFVISIAIIAFS